jgi:hypothetical protein
MKREVVQDFLNLPGVTGLALMDGRSRPYFCGVDRALNFQQKEALAQGIQQVVETTPASFDFFEFQFSKHQVYIYKLHHGMILLVLTSDALSYGAYLQVIERLKAELQQDISNTIATFRLLAGNTTLSGQNYWKAPEVSNSEELSQSASPSNGTNPHSVADSPSAFSPSSSVSTIALEEVLIAMNTLSHYAAQYLGPSVVANYWKASRPNADWLSAFQVERSAQIIVLGKSALLTAEQHQWLKDWVDAFINRCTKVIRDFPKSVRHAALDERQRALLLPN